MILKNVIIYIFIKYNKKNISNKFIKILKNNQIYSIFYESKIFKTLISKVFIIIKKIRSYNNI